LWISKKELERLKQLEQSFIKCMRRNSGEDCRYKEMQKNLVSLSDYYAERLEWWKGRFGKKPTRHEISLYMIEGDCLKEFWSDTELWQLRYQEIKSAIETDNTIGFDENKTVIVKNIKYVHTLKGHPDPYTDSEIESWAKEQLEQEMKGCRVVKEEPERLYKWHAMLTNISGD
jgi:hypothetical protein